jgi:hypothetical protein
MGVKKILRCEWTLGILFILAVTLSASDGHLFPLPNLGGLVMLGGFVVLSRDSARRREEKTCKGNRQWVLPSMGVGSDRVTYPVKADTRRKPSHRNCSGPPEKSLDQDGLGTVGQVA